MNVKAILVLFVFIFSGCTSLSRMEARLNGRLDGITVNLEKLQADNERLAEQLGDSIRIANELAIENSRLRTALESLGKSLAELDGYSVELDDIIERIEGRPSIDYIENRSP